MAGKSSKRQALSLFFWKRIRRSVTQKTASVFVLARFECWIQPATSSAPARIARYYPRLFARVAVTLPLNLFENLSKILARWVLHRREIHVGLELLEPQHLADRQNVPVVEIRGTRGGKCTAVA